jgi:antitoxin VapB
MDKKTGVKTARVFRQGDSQVVRLPKEIRFEGGEVLVKRTAAGALLLPARITRERLEAALAPLLASFARQATSRRRGHRGRGHGGLARSHVSAREATRARTRLPSLSRSTCDRARPPRI